MKYLVYPILLLCAALLLACQSQKKETATFVKHKPAQAQLSEVALQEYETAYFASGCFWCVEAIFESVRGVKEVVSGYAGGTEKNPTYEQVAYGKTTHAEAVKIYYDPKVVSFSTLVTIFFGSHDPTTLNRQGPDRGPQYRSIAFYNTEEEKNTIVKHIEKLDINKVYDRDIVTEVKPLKEFYVAEDYHQDFERRNPNNPYIKNVSIPRFKKFKEEFKEYVEEHH